MKKATNFKELKEMIKNSKRGEIIIFDEKPNQINERRSQKTKWHL